MVHAAMNQLSIDSNQCIKFVRYNTATDNGQDHVYIAPWPFFRVRVTVYDYEFVRKCAEITVILDSLEMYKLSFFRIFLLIVTGKHLRHVSRTRAALSSKKVTAS